MNKYVIAIGGVLCILVGVLVYGSFSKKMSGVPVGVPRELPKEPLQTDQSTRVTMQLQKPTLLIDPKKMYSVVLKTSEGDITIEFTAAKTPKTVNNFVYLARQNFYDNTIFHRVISGFMIQGGDPQGNGSGGPGYSFDDEPFDGTYQRGTVAMANSGPNTNGSQFFIMHKDYDLPKNYVIFGHVTKGLDVVDKIATSPVTAKNGENSSPVTPVVVKTIEVTEQ